VSPAKVDAITTTAINFDRYKLSADDKKKDK